MAIAEPSSSPEVPGTHSNDVPGNGPKADPDGGGGSGASRGSKPDNGKTDDRKTDEDKPGYGGNPARGNCGNKKGNGNAQHCGGSSQSTPRSVTPPTTPPTQTSNTATPATEATSGTSTSTETSTSSETTSSESTSSQTTTSETKTTTSETTETSTSPTTTTSLGLPPPGGSDGGAVEVPSGRPELPPEMLLPPASEPSVIDSVAGIGAAAAQVPVQPITLPVIVAPAIGLGGGGGSPGSPALPLTPRGVTAEPPAGREPLPANVGSNVAVPATSYRIGYTEYLRNAGLSQVAVLAVPGLAGMLVLTGAGGLVGYRQAKAGHAVHTGGTARFVN
jgi:hypothetical protein